RDCSRLDGHANQPHAESAARPVRIEYGVGARLRLRPEWLGSREVLAIWQQQGVAARFVAPADRGSRRTDHRPRPDPGKAETGPAAGGPARRRLRATLQQHGPYGVEDTPGLSR